MPDPYGTPEMIEISGDSHITTKSRTQRPRAAEHAYCPRHADHRNKTALDLSGEHLVWREHEVVTWGHDRRVCLASGTPICEQPPKVKPIIQCPCGTTHGAA